MVEEVSVGLLSTLEEEEVGSSTFEVVEEEEGVATSNEGSEGSEEVEVDSSTLEVSSTVEEVSAGFSVLVEEVLLTVELMMSLMFTFSLRSLQPVSVRVARVTIAIKSFFIMYHLRRIYFFMLKL